MTTRALASAIYTAQSPLIVIVDEGLLPIRGSLQRNQLRAGLDALHKREMLSCRDIILHGTYRIDVEAISEVDMRVAHSRVGGTDVELCPLQCPSGRLVLVDPELGNQRPLCSVEPGRYRAGLDWNLEEEQKHWELTCAEQYPKGDGPDGILLLCRLGAL